MSPGLDIFCVSKDRFSLSLFLSHFLNFCLYYDQLYSALLCSCLISSLTINCTLAWPAHYELSPYLLPGTFGCLSELLGVVFRKCCYVDIMPIGARYPKIALCQCQCIKLQTNKNISQSTTLELHLYGRSQQVNHVSHRNMLQFQLKEIWKIVLYKTKNATHGRCARWFDIWMER